MVYTLNWGGNYTGSISRIIRDIEDSLKQDDVTFVHYYESGEPGKDNYFRLSGWLMSHLYYYWAHFTGNRYGTGTIPAKKFINAVKQGRPDVVHIHCPNGFSINIYMVLDYLKKNRIPTVVTNHAEFFYTGNCAHAIDCTQFIHGCQKCPDHRGQGKSIFFDRSRYTWKRMKKVFEGYESLAMVGVSPWSVSRIRMSDITAGADVRLVENGVDDSVFRYTADMTSGTDEDERILILQVTSAFTLDDDDLKGGRYFWRLAREFEHDNRFLFIVAGNYRVGDAAVPKNMRFLGAVGKAEDLAGLYSRCDLMVTTGRRET
ncbi:MAG: glycosyltransferase, partial [Lachnospiraceae bacterium]|nr:glycosyltransferase [Lachnospiraceae bacterium]